ncbi:hypothetical protein FPQ18DRAFT_414005 [Pyronema domesticum]|nr:hypothetical protein FPQ18DRAFT_414005 [Pyronema domesticum]
MKMRKRRYMKKMMETMKNKCVRNILIKALRFRTPLVLPVNPGVDVSGPPALTGPDGPDEDVQPEPDKTSFPSACNALKYSTPIVDCTNKSADATADTSAPAAGIAPHFSQMEPNSTTQPDYQNFDLASGVVELFTFYETPVPTVEDVHSHILKNFPMLIPAIRAVADPDLTAPAVMAANGGIAAGT